MCLSHWTGIFSLHIFGLDSKKWRTPEMCQKKKIHIKRDLQKRRMYKERRISFLSLIRLKKMADFVLICIRVVKYTCLQIVHTRTHKCTYTHAHACTDTHTHTHTRTQAYVRVSVCVHLYTYSYVFIDAHTHTYIYKCMYTYICVYVCAHI